MHSYFEDFRCWKHLLLLIALLALLVVEPLISSFGILTSLFDVLFVLLLIVLALVLARGKTCWSVALLFTVPAVVLLIAARMQTSSTGQISLYCSHGIGAVFFVVVACQIVASLFRTRDLSLDSVFGAVCGYLLLGVAWGLTYAMLYAASPESFDVTDSHRPSLPEQHEVRSLFMYYSFVTQTTIGYGDVTPVSTAARTLSWVEAVAGQMYLAILIAGLVSTLVAKNASAATAPATTHGHDTE